MSSIFRINKIREGTNKIDMHQTWLIRSLFWIKLIKLLTKDITLANVGECTIEYKTGECYSWCKKDHQLELQVLPY